MRRTQIQFDEKTFQELRRRAFESGRSTASLVREATEAYLALAAPAVPKSIREVSFVGAGRSGGATSRVSESHDEALAEIFARRSDRLVGKKGPKRPGKKR